MKYAWISKHVYEKNIVKLITDLVRIPNISVEEREIADYIFDKMQELGFARARKLGDIIDKNY